MKKVLITGPRIDGISGGQATHMRNLLDISKTMPNFDVAFFYTSKGLDANDSAFNKVMFFIKSFFLFPFSCLGKGIIHINSSFDKKAIVRDLFFICTAFLLRKKLVIQYHGGIPQNLPKWLRFLTRFTLALCRKSDFVLCLTEAQQAFLELSSNLNVLKVKNYVRLPDERKVSESRSKVVFLYMGRMIKEKGIFQILESVKLLRKDGYFDFEIRFCGSGQDLELFLKQIDTDDLSENMSYLGTVYGDQKVEVFRQADLFLYPTVYPEGLPYSILEAMSFGLPVIATNVGSITSVVHQNQTGIVVAESDSIELGDAMKRLAFEAPLRRTLGSSARKLIMDEYSIEAMNQMFSEIWGKN